MAKWLSMAVERSHLWPFISATSSVPAFSFQRVDDGEQAARSYKMSPVLAPDPWPDLAAAAAEFAGCCRELPGEIAVFVLEKLRIKVPTSET